MFSGASNLAVDPKGRIAIPTRHRDALTQDGEGLITVTADAEGCLMVYQYDEWLRIANQLRVMSNLKQDVRLLQEMFVGHAETMPLDSAGRIQLTPELRAFANIGTRALLMGQFNKFYLWDEAKYETRKTLAQVAARAPTSPELQGFST